MTDPGPLEYQTFRGARFTVVERPDGLVASITGTGLTLQGTQPDDVEGPGYIALRGNRRTPSEGQVVSPLVPDRFRGSGYRRSRNLVTTSAEFVDAALKPIAEALGDAYLAAHATALTLRVAVEWAELDDEELLIPLIDLAMREAGEERLDGPRRMLFDQAVRERLEATMARSCTNLMRVRNCRYSGVLHLGHGERPVEHETGCDLWL